MNLASISQLFEPPARGLTDETLVYSSTVLCGLSVIVSFWDVTIFVVIESAFHRRIRLATTSRERNRLLYSLHFFTYAFLLLLSVSVIHVAMTVLLRVRAYFTGLQGATLRFSVYLLPFSVFGSALFRYGAAEVAERRCIRNMTVYACDLH